MRFIAYIISYGRPNNSTANYLEKINYAGEWKIVVDNSDKTIPQYIERWGENRLIIYDKKDIDFDTCLKDKIYTTATFSRNACELLAKLGGYDYFCLFDDDINYLSLRYEVDNKLKGRGITKNLDVLFERIIQYMSSANIATVCFGYNTIYMGGLEGFKVNNDKLRRLCAEAFIRNTHYDVVWNGTYMEDFIASIEYGRKGQVWLQIPDIQVNMPPAYKSQLSGGNTELYNSIEKIFKVKEITKVFFPESTILYVKDNDFSLRPQNNLIVPKIVGE